MSTKKIRIFLADDHQVLIDGMKSVLATTSDLEFVGSASNGLNVIADAVKTKTDILVIDINMPEKDGISLLKDYSQNEFPFRIIVLSSYDDIKLIKEVMKLGASGYLTKQCAGEDILEAIHTVANGEFYYCKTVRDKIFASFANPQKNNSGSNSHSVLTERELEIIKLISMEYSGKEIGEALSISSHTVETHRKNLMKKLEVKNTIGLVKYALKNNLINQ
ncbi:DNA-binding response regulator [Flavobacterium noncentrifugens]|uniref:Two component transcriptional regulator, LuxR family n=1 Tax=Flavobacterium noncentrifugens TaxID=1128970 RepID=A0A1G9C016_9FLAO|nr:response regulator transcription factor [Flavobacterium noncentrifugens]GEP52428.1 DNA-binding response regulator [Flavobacterium noncentrifugens]SDK45071.1 two component transcriptional regulator, LuxR family [Flavobacterium noncentrifugens]